MPVTPVSHLLGEAVLAHVRDGDRVLDMGTGSGVNAVLAAARPAEFTAAVSAFLRRPSR
jgi:release factor glutamine methyltransferase